jgi:hypothetical protein
MINFKKIVQGGPEAMLQYTRIPCVEHCIYGGKGKCKVYPDTTFCDNGRLAWLNSPAKPTLTEDEKIAIRNWMYLGFGWVAKDKNDILSVFARKPTKLKCEWLDGDTNMIYSGPHQFNFIQWTDSEPAYLPDLLKGGDEA